MSLIKSEPPQCPVCYAEYEDVSLGEPNIPEKDRRRTLNLPCGHTICTSCFSNLTRDVCPVCIEPINLNTIYNRNYSLEDAVTHINVLTDKNWECMLCRNTYAVKKMFFCMTCFRYNCPKTCNNVVHCHSARQTFKFPQREIRSAELCWCQNCCQKNGCLEKHDCWEFGEFYNALKKKMGAVRVVQTKEEIVHDLVDEKVEDFDYKLAKKIANVNLRAENAKKQKMMEAALQKKIQHQLQPGPRPEQPLPMPQPQQLPFQPHDRLFFCTCFATHQLDQAPVANAPCGFLFPIVNAPLPINGQAQQYHQ